MTTESSNILFTITTTAGIDVRNSEIKTADGVSTIAAGGINFFNSKIQDFTITSSVTASITANNSWFFNAGINTTIFTIGGSATSVASNCYFESGTASALTVNGTLTLANCNITSSNAAAISGSGTFRWTGLGFTGTSSTITTTTQTPLQFLSNVKAVKSPGAYPYTVLKSDEVVLVDTSAARTINLPASPQTGITFRIKDSVGTASSFNITVTPAAGNIDGAGSYVININYGSVDVVYNGTSWSIV